MFREVVDNFTRNNFAEHTKFLSFDLYVHLRRFLWSTPKNQFFAYNFYYAFFTISKCSSKCFTLLKRVSFLKKVYIYLPYLSCYWNFYFKKCLCLTCSFVNFRTFLQTRISSFENMERVLSIANITSFSPNFACILKFTY